MDRLTIFFDLDDTLYDRSIPYERAFSQFFGGRYAEKLPQAFDADHSPPATRCLQTRTPEKSAWRPCISTAIRPSGRRRYLYYAGRGAALSGTLRRAAAPHHAERYHAPRAGPVQERFAAVGVITNGSVGSQTGKLKSLGMERWVPAQLVFISDAVGVMKPAPEIFRMAQKAAGGGPCLFVGDSCTQDIAGAAACGWQTIWMNRRGEAPGDICPSCTATSEQALLELPLQTIADNPMIELQSHQ